MKKLIMLGFLLFAVSAASQPFDSMLRFFGNGVASPDNDRIKIQIDEVANSNPGPPADVGATDFTIEFWMNAASADNTASAITCGANNNWINGNIIIDRDRYNQPARYGLSIQGGNFAFGVSGESSGEITICGDDDVLDSNWHHIAVMRRASDGFVWLYVDGVLDASGDGPDGDVSYPDAGTPCSDCCGGGNCNNSDPFIVIGAEKHDAGESFPSYNGYFDELRISTTLRYTANFAVPSSRFVTDGNTAALYHFDEGTGTTINDVSGASGGPSNGVMNVGGSPSGPTWNTSTVPSIPTFPGVPTSLSDGAAPNPAFPSTPTGLTAP